MLKTDVPRTSLGMRSGVNCMRENRASMSRDTSRASKVFATPGTPSNSTCPSAMIDVRTMSTALVCPTIMSAICCFISSILWVNSVKSVLVSIVSLIYIIVFLVLLSIMSFIVVCHKLLYLFQDLIHTVDGPLHLAFVNGAFSKIVQTQSQQIFLHLFFFQ